MLSLSAVALTGPAGQPSDGPKPLSFLLFSVSWKADYFFVWIFPPWDLEKLQYTRVNILDLKILQVFFKNRGEILVFEKLLNFLSFLVLLYVSGHSKQKIFCLPHGRPRTTSFLHLLGHFTFCFRTFQAKKFFFKIFQTKKFKYWQINYMNWWQVKIFLSVWKILKIFFLLEMSWNIK